MAFVISSMNVNIDVNEIVDEVLGVITEDCNNAICDCFEGLDESDDFFYHNEKEIDNTIKFVMRRVAERLLEN